MQIFNKNKFFPQNFLLSDCGESRENIIEQICSEAYRISPCSFNGECLYFKFILRYCPPYEQDRFRELKRLQAVARSNVRFKYGYKGYIVIDISEWVGHMDEELLSKVTMAFLYDMSDRWKYIFITSGAEISEEVKVLNKYFKIKELTVSAELSADPFSRFFEKLGEKFDIGFSANAAELFHQYITKKDMQSKETVHALEKDLNIFFGLHSCISKEMLAEYLINADSAGYDLLSKKDISELYSIIGEAQRV